MKKATNVEEKILTSISSFVFLAQLLFQIVVC